MNPFLVGLTIGCWAVFLVGLMTMYMDGKVGENSYFLLGFFLMCLFFTIIEAADWERHNSGMMPATINIESKQ